MNPIEMLLQLIRGQGQEAPDTTFQHPYRRIPVQPVQPYSPPVMGGGSKAHSPGFDRGRMEELMAAWRGGMR